MIVIGTYATKSYTYAMEAQEPAILSALRYAEVGLTGVHQVYVGDKSKEAASTSRRRESFCRRAGIGFTFIALDGMPDNGNALHVAQSNMGIARMQAAAFMEAQMLGADLFWSLESDILPQPKVLRCMMDALTFDRGWYDIAMATYPNSEFLGGHGSPSRWILPSVYPEERAIPEALQQRMDAKAAREKELAQENKRPTKEEIESWQKIDKDIEAAPPKGHAMQLNATRWRRRGWLDNAYPAIGRGAILPTDWVGVGCTLLSRKALDLADFTGYDGGGTQDLWLCWRCWQPAALKLAVVTHALCSHVKRDPTTKALNIMHARHELGGECDGHLRSEKKPWALGSIQGVRP